jgi:hypothetical protein
MNKIAEYRQSANECLLLAAKANNQKAKSYLLDAAEEWERLAAEHKRRPFAPALANQLQQ